MLVRWLNLSVQRISTSQVTILFRESVLVRWLWVCLYRESVLVRWLCLCLFRESVLLWWLFLCVQRAKDRHIKSSGLWQCPACQIAITVPWGVRLISIACPQTKPCSSLGNRKKSSTGAWCKVSSQRIDAVVLLLSIILMLYRPTLAYIRQSDHSLNLKFTSDVNSKQIVYADTYIFLCHMYIILIMCQQERW